MFEASTDRFLLSNIDLWEMGVPIATLNSERSANPLNAGQHAIATAAGAHLCCKYGVSPRDICNDHMSELQSLAATFTGRNLGALSDEMVQSKL